MAVLHKCSHEKMHDLSVRLVAIEQELHRAGLHATARATNRAVQAIGWEFAGEFDQIAKLDESKILPPPRLPR